MKILNEEVTTFTIVKIIYIIVMLANNLILLHFISNTEKAEGASSKKYWYIIQSGITIVILLLQLTSFFNLIQSQQRILMFNLFVVAWYSGFLFEMFQDTMWNQVDKESGYFYSGIAFVNWVMAYFLGLSIINDHYGF